MILQQKQAKIPWLKQVKPVGIASMSLTIPGQSMNLKYAMEQYNRGSLVERAKGFYEKKGLVTPNFDQMNKIEKLMALAQYRKDVIASEKKLSNLKKKAENEMVQKQKESVASSKKDDTTNPNPV